MNVLTLENVNYSYKGSNRKVLENVNVSFYGGRIYAVTGPSGSGKTTLLSILAGLDIPTEGDVELNNQKLSTMDLDQYRRVEVSMIFQAFHLFPMLTVLENVSFPMELNGVDREEARIRSKVFLSSVGITDDKHKRFPSNLSGGEQQRVAIARTMASGARLILADEPTGNLDKENGQNIVDILKVLAHENGYCVIIVTHDPFIANQTDEVYVMENGQVILREG